MKRALSGWAAAVCIWALLPLQAADELLKPVTNPQGGPVVDGLQGHLDLVKSSFGPGESVLGFLTLTNHTDSARRLTELPRQLQVEIVQHGKLPAKIVGSTVGDALELPPGQGKRCLVDLGADQGWTAKRGVYRLRLHFGAGAEQVSNWVECKIERAGSDLPRLGDPKREEELLKLISQLGADEYAQREAAERAILAFGIKAIPYLSDALEEYREPEIRIRLGKLIEQLKTGKTTVPPSTRTPEPLQEEEIVEF